MAEAGRGAPGGEDLLVVGDVHLGRRPVGLDEALAECGLAPRDLTPARALESLVEHALDDPPRAVLLAGDVVDEARDRFEAYHALERAASRLAERGVPVLAVAGNHDGLVLPRLADRVSGARLVGRDGVWERVELPGDGTPVDLLGWSFPGPHHRDCPLDDPSFDAARRGARPGARVIGLLHADLDAPGSTYAPVPRARLEATDLAAWFLGHVHQPDDLGGPRPIGYLGSLVGLDAGETGRRGAWRARPAADGVRLERVDVGPLRWERMDVALDEGEAADADDVHERLLATVSGTVASFDGLDALRAVVVRARFTGRSRGRDGVRAFVANHDPARTVASVEGIPVIVERVSDATRPAVDLDALATEPSPLGFVAAHLAALRDGDAAAVAAARDTVERVGSAARWRLDDADDDDTAVPEAAALAERAAWRVLEALLDQRDEAGG